MKNKPRSLEGNEINFKLGYQLFDINYCLLQILLAKAYKYKFGYFTYKKNYHFFNLRENSFSKSGKFEQENENICLFFNCEGEIHKQIILKVISIENVF